MSNFNQRVFGCAIIRTINANYNADFSHQPRTLPNGICYATDKALKYLIRNFIKANYSESEKVFYFKSFDNQMKPLSLNKRFLSFFKEFPKNTANDSEKEGEYYLFLKQGEIINGLIGSKIPKKKIEDFFKDLDKESDLQEQKSVFLKLSDKNIKSKPITNIANALKEEEEDFYFYFNEDKIIKILKDEASEEILKGIELRLTGGINKPVFANKLLSCIDIRLFGATYAGETNISIHGPVQINHGINIWKENNIFSEQIMSPFADKEGAEASTLGRQSKLQEGHYLHHISVNPKNLDEIVSLSGATPLSIDDMDKLKSALCLGATYFDSSAKAGIDNEALVWVTLKEGAKSVLPTFNNLIKLDKVENKVVLDLTDLTAAVKRLGEDVSSVEIYYLAESVNVVNAHPKTKFFDISSSKEINKS
jgi:CRISPR/Cas system type I-B associated protein Csh2 (Cas7 group RAMP superfamily)